MAKRLFADTDEAAERVLIELARQTPVWRKFQQVCELSAATRQFALAGLRQRYPNASEAELQRRLAAVLFDRKTIRQVFGWDPEVEGY